MYKDFQIIQRLFISGYTFSRDMKQIFFFKKIHKTFQRIFIEFFQRIHKNVSWDTQQLFFFFKEYTERFKGYTDIFKGFTDILERLYTNVSRDTRIFFLQNYILNVSNNVQKFSNYIEIFLFQDTLFLGIRNKYFKKKIHKTFQRIFKEIFAKNTQKCFQGQPAIIFSKGYTKRLKGYTDIFKGHSFSKDTMKVFERFTQVFCLPQFLHTNARIGLQSVHILSK